MDPNTFFSNGDLPASSPDPATQEATTPIQEATQPVPGSAGEPGQEQQMQQQPGETPDEAAQRIAEAEQRAQQAEQEAMRWRGEMQQFQQGLQMWSQQQEMQQRRKGIYERARTISDDDERERYIMAEEGRVQQEVAQMYQQQIQQVKHALGTPLFIDDLIRRHNLPQEAKARLMAFGDPNVAAQQAEFIKADYERIARLEQQLNQQSRSQQATALRDAGLGTGGGTGQVASPPLQETGDPDTDAIAIYEAIRAGTYAGAQT